MTSLGASLNRIWRNLLLRFRVFHVSPLSVPRDAYSPDYLMLVLQAKRLAATRALTKFRLRNLLLWPFYAGWAFLRIVDLRLTTILIESMLLEERLKASPQPDDAQLPKEPPHVGDRQA